MGLSWRTVPMPVNAAPDDPITVLRLISELEGLSGFVSVFDDEDEVENEVVEGVINERMRTRSMAGEKELEKKSNLVTNDRMKTRSTANKQVKIVETKLKGVVGLYDSLEKHETIENA